MERQRGRQALPTDTDHLLQGIDGENRLCEGAGGSAWQVRSSDRPVDLKVTNGAVSAAASFGPAGAVVPPSHLPASGRSDQRSAPF